MATEIRVWHIQKDKTLTPIQSTLAEAGRTEPDDLEEWIASAPEILGERITIIGQQVQTVSGPLDLLGIDKDGNTVIVELKRDMIPREALAQAIDYASAVAEWDVNELEELCWKEYGETIADLAGERLAQTEDTAFNQAQRILLVGTSVDPALEGMVKWMSGTHQVPVNIVLVNYIKTPGGDELLARSVVVSEDEEAGHIRRKRGMVELSDEPAVLDETHLREQLKLYLSSEKPTPRRVRSVLLPLCLAKPVVSRDDIIHRLVETKEAKDSTQAGFIVASISGDLGMAKRGWLRQLIKYERPEDNWIKDNYRLADEYRGLVQGLLGELVRPGANQGQPPVSP